MEGKLNALALVESLRNFDAFPKVQKSYQRRSGSNIWRRAIYSIPAIFILILWINEFYAFGRGALEYKFAVSPNVQQHIEINIDLTISIPCENIALGLVDRTKQVIMIESLIYSERTELSTDHAHLLSEESRKAKDVDRLFMQNAVAGSLGPRFKYQQNAPACRIFGAFEAHRVTGELSIAANDGYMCNSSHVIHDFSFGKFYQNVERPLTNVYGIANDENSVFEYYVNGVETLYTGQIRKLPTYQYSANSFVKKTIFGCGLLFHYDFDPLLLTVSGANLPLHIILLRTLNIVGGVLIGFEILFKTVQNLLAYRDNQSHHGGLLESKDDDISD